MSNFSAGMSPFYDDVNFPRGINRSGDFSCKEAQLLALYGNTMKAIDIGTLEPSNDEEQRFLAVARGTEIAETAHEKVWLKYIRLTQAPKLFFPLAGGRKINKQPALAIASD